MDLSNILQPVFQVRHGPCLLNTDVSSLGVGDERHSILVVTVGPRLGVLPPTPSPRLPTSDE